jgi:transcription termination factor NusB
MTPNDQPLSQEDETKAKVAEAVGRNENIRRQVRDIVIEALAKKSVDRDSVKNTMDAVLEGAIDAAPEDQKELAEVLKKTVDGMEEALAKAAEASKLAVEESGGRLDSFAEQDLKAAAEDLKDLEALFLQTLKDLAVSGHTTVGTLLRDAVNHAERTGTDIGRAVQEALEALHGPLSQAARPHLADVERAGKAGAASLASIASGILAGIAESLKAEPEETREPGENKDG